MRTPMLLLLAAVPAAACGAPQVADCPPCEALATEVEVADVTTADTVDAVGTGPHNNLNAVVWIQTAIEARALSLSAWRDAADALEPALADVTWTAAPEEQTGDFAHLPPAVVVDLDETLIDNSAYQAHLVASGTGYSTSSWAQWCNAGQATAVPGALEFAAHARELGVTLVYITNRAADCEAATVANLQALGFDASDELVVTRDESDAGSAKGARRAQLALTHRILLLVGDNFGDFVDSYNGSPAEREARAAAFDAFWGQRWFVIPNPTYGSWIDAVTPTDADDTQQLRDALRVWTP